MLSKAPSKHSEEKGRRALSPTGVRAILDVASNFTRQFSPQSRSWLPLTKELLEESPPHTLSVQLHSGRVRNLPWGVRHCLHLGKRLPWGSQCSRVPCDRLGAGEGSQSPCTSRGSGARACLDPPCPGRRWRPRGGRAAAKGRGARPLPGGARHVEQTKGKGEGLCRGAAGPSPTPFLPPASRGATPEPLPSGPARLRSPLPACGGWCFGTPRPAPRLSRERLVLRATSASPMPSLGNTAGPSADVPRAVPQEPPGAADGKVPSTGSGSGSNPGPRIGCAPGPRAGDTPNRRE